jgi:hypothetical protein
VAVADLEAEIDRLYGLPLEEFTKERNELARRLKAEGNQVGEATVRALAKPTVVAWVVNQLARREPEQIGTLASAAGAQERALSAADGDALRQAMADEREVLRSLAAAARQLLREAGRGAGAVERVSSTLAAAAADPETRALLERGRLQTEVTPSGFTALSGLQARARPRQAAPGRPGDELAQRRRERAEAAERARRLRAELRDLRKQAREAERAAIDLEREAATARTRADELRAQVERLERELET